MSDLVAAICERNPLQTSFLDTAMAGISEVDKDSLEEFIHYCLGRGQSVDFLADCYGQVVRDMLVEQFYFRRHKRYRFSSYAAVAKSVYENPEYMTKYMQGLALTAYLWPNHVAIRRFFQETLPRKKRGLYLEIGPGHGLFLLAAARSSRFDRLLGVDISATSVQLTRAIVDEKLGDAAVKVDLRECDFLTSDFDGPFDAIVAGEVLEHVEDPVRFLERMRSNASPGAYVFLTTCANAPAFDHIFLFRSPNEVESLIKSAGFRIERSLILPHASKTLRQCAADDLPVNMAYVLS